jgi:DNA-binding NtrC family response regulator
MVSKTNLKEQKHMENDPIKIMYVNSNDADTVLLNSNLKNFEGAQFEIIGQQSIEKAVEYLGQQPEIDVIIIENDLSEMSGVEFARRLKDLKYEIPIVFIANSEDVSRAVEAMRVGAKDYLSKADIASHIIPQSLLRVVEKARLIQELSELEKKQRRLEAMQEIVLSISGNISKPLDDMNKLVSSFGQYSLPEKGQKYVKLIKENVERMQLKLDKLKNLKEDKTVKYIRDIKMIDLS